MYIVLIAWLYVALMMAIAEATSPVGSVLGAFFTFILYGLLPMVIVGYVMGAPARRKARQAAEQSASEPLNTAPNTSGEASSHTVSSVRKEP
jgi:mannose/fructose/N-acetylgalactosamine-specific phosphotransferase system component IID